MNAPLFYPQKLAIPLPPDRGPRLRYGRQRSTCLDMVYCGAHPPQHLFRLNCARVQGASCEGRVRNANIHHSVHHDSPRFLLCQHLGPKPFFSRRHPWALEAHIVNGYHHRRFSRRYMGWIYFELPRFCTDTFRCGTLTHSHCSS